MFSCQPDSKGQRQQQRTPSMERMSVIASRAKPPRTTVSTCRPAGSPAVAHGLQPGQQQDCTTVRDTPSGATSTPKETSRSAVPEARAHAWPRP